MDFSSTHNTYAKKLNINIVDIDLTRKTKSIAKHFKHNTKNTYGVIMNYVSVENSNKFISLLPVELRFSCLSVLKSSIRSLPPHTHGVGGCVINFYCKTNGEKTVCYDGDYEEIMDDAATFQSDKGYYIVDQNKLTEVFSYTAESGDVYLLNTRKPHAVVDANNLDKSRIVIQIYLDISYKEAYNLLEHHFK